MTGAPSPSRAAPATKRRMSPAAATPLNVRPSNACAAVAPRHTSTRGFTSAISVSSHGRQARDLAGVRLRVDAPLAARLPFEVFDDVGHVDVATVDARPLPALGRAACRPVRRKDAPPDPRHHQAARRPASRPPAAGPRRRRSACRACRDRRPCSLSRCSGQCEASAVAASGSAPVRPAWARTRQPARQSVLSATEFLQRPGDVLPDQRIGTRLSSARARARSTAAGSPELPIADGQVAPEAAGHLPASSHCPSAAPAAHRLCVRHRSSSRRTHRARLVAATQRSSDTRSRGKFQGQTSWQMSQPYACSPTASRCPPGIAPLFSIVRYDRQRVEIELRGRDERAGWTRIEHSVQRPH